MRITKCPLRIDIAGGSLDIQDIPKHFGPVKVVSAAIDKYVTAKMYTKDDTFTVIYELEKGISTGSGLGTSGAMNTAWLALISNCTDPHLLASRVYGMEQATGVVGGVQDQYMAAYGGIRAITMIDDNVWPIMLIDRRCADIELLPHMMLVDSLIIRSATDMNRQFIDRYDSGQLFNEIVDLINLSNEMSNTIEFIGKHHDASTKSHVRYIGKMIDEEWSIRKRLMPVNTTEIDDIIHRCKRVSMDIHAKVLGAAGGGCILFWMNDPDVYGRLASLINDELKCKVIDFEFDYNGITLEDNDNE